MNIPVNMEDIQKVLEANPEFNLQVKCMALIRMLEEKDAEIAKLREYARNGSESHVERL